MFATRIEGRVGAKRTPARRFLPVLLTIALLVPIQSIDAAVPNTSGTVQLGNTLIYGTTAYSVDYLYPSQAQVGTNLSITVTLHVNELTGLAEYISHYQFNVEVNVGLKTLNGTITGGNNTALPLPKYPGAVWGPNTLAIPLTANNTGLAKGDSANATVSITLQDLVWYNVPIGNLVSEPPMLGAIGSLIIQNSVATSSSSTSGGQSTGQTQTYLPYILLASGAVLMLSAVFLPRGPRPPQANHK
jgi:hypothetical protein